MTTFQQFPFLTFEVCDIKLDDFDCADATTILGLLDSVINEQP